MRLPVLDEPVPAHRRHRREGEDVLPGIWEARSRRWRSRLIGEGARSSEPQLSPNYEDWVEQTEPLFELASETGEDEEDDPSVQ